VRLSSFLSFFWQNLGAYYEEDFLADLKKKTKTFRRTNDDLATIFRSGTRQSTLKKVTCECGKTLSPTEMVKHSYNCPEFQKRWTPP